MATGYSTTLRNSQLDQVSTLAGTGAKILLQDGTRPATGGTLTNTLGTFTLSGVFAPASSGGVLTANNPPNTSGSAAGTATWYRITSSAGVFVMDGSVGTTGTDLIINTTTISVGLTLSVTSHTITCGNA